MAYDMARPAEKLGKGRGEMEPPEILKAANRMDFAAVVAAVEADRNCVFQTDYMGHNAIHILVMGGVFRTKEIIRYLLGHTEISLHHPNERGCDPLDLAIEMGDEKGAEFLWPYWTAESKRHQDSQHRPHLTVVPPGKKRDDPKPGPQ